MKTLAMLGLLSFAFVAQAEDIVFGDLEYISGKDGIISACSGVAVVNSEELIFYKRKQGGDVLFRIPIKYVQRAECSTEIDHGSLGGKIFWGPDAVIKEKEFVAITTASEENAESIVIRCHTKKTGPGMVTKIEFLSKKARGEWIKTLAAEGDKK